MLFHSLIIAAIYNQLVLLQASLNNSSTGIRVNVMCDTNPKHIYIAAQYLLSVS